MLCYFKRSLFLRHLITDPGIKSKHRPENFLGQALGPPNKVQPPSHGCVSPAKAVLTDSRCSRVVGRGEGHVTVLPGWGHPPLP